VRIVRGRPEGGEMSTTHLIHEGDVIQLDDGIRRKIVSIVESPAWPGEFVVILYPPPVSGAKAWGTDEWMGPR
jgi:hypothetical protein